ncbi:hypothetical protein [Actinophytocola sp.]|uniref:hypothetical protein n=1 Tax=Actinophytocola sp. TaxID=1872138 RepID=UPI00389ABF20
MAKTHMPLPTGGKTLSKLISAFVAVALLVIAVKHPSEAATMVKALGGAIVDVIERLWTFVQQFGG